MTPVEYAEWTRRPDESTTWRFEARLSTAGPDRRTFLATVTRSVVLPTAATPTPVDLDPRPFGAVHRATATQARDGEVAVTVRDVFQQRFDDLNAAIEWADGIVAANPGRADLP